MIAMLAFLLGGFMVATAALGLYVYHQHQQIVVLEDILATMASDRAEPELMDEWGD